MNHFRQRWLELLDQPDTERNTVIKQWCDQKAGEIEMAEFIKNNQRRVVHSPHDTFVHSWLVETYSNDYNVKRIKIY